jgi:SAM-dependent methyltransferase
MKKTTPSEPKDRHWTRTFFSDVYRGIGLDERVDLGPDEAMMVKKALKLNKGARVLDLCCGIGRHSVPLAKLGLNVTGLDLTPGYLKEARATARRAKVKARFIQGDMRELDFDSEFDAVVSLFTSFGYYDDATDQQVLHRIARALKPRGQLYIDVMNRDYAIRCWDPWHVEDKPGLTIMVKHEFDTRTSRIMADWRVIRHGRVEPVGAFDLRLYARHELTAMLAAAGLTVTAVMGDLNGAPFVFDSRRLVIIARKS